jgi:hypothetical protein
MQRGNCYHKKKMCKDETWSLLPQNANMQKKCKVMGETPNLNSTCLTHWNLRISSKVSSRENKQVEGFEFYFNSIMISSSRIRVYIKFLIFRFG